MNRKLVLTFVGIYLIVVGINLFHDSGSTANDSMVGLTEASQPGFAARDNCTSQCGNPETGD